MDRKPSLGRAQAASTPDQVRGGLSRFREGWPRDTRVVGFRTRCDSPRSMHNSAITARTAMPASFRIGVSMEDEVLCVARRHGEVWEAFCLNFDLAVQGRSFDEVRGLLSEAVKSYVEDASAETEPARSRLLRRGVPLHVRLLWASRFFWRLFPARPMTAIPPSDFRSRAAPEMHVSRVHRAIPEVTTGRSRSSWVRCS